MILVLYKEYLLIYKAVAMKLYMKFQAQGTANPLRRVVLGCEPAIVSCVRSTSWMCSTLSTARLVHREDTRTSVHLDQVDKLKGTVAIFSHCFVQKPASGLISASVWNAPTLPALPPFLQTSTLIGYLVNEEDKSTLIYQNLLRFFFSECGGWTNHV